MVFYFSKTHNRNGKIWIKHILLSISWPFFPVQCLLNNVRNNTHWASDCRVPTLNVPFDVHTVLCYSPFRHFFSVIAVIRSILSSPRIVAINRCVVSFHIISKFLTFMLVLVLVHNWFFMIIFIRLLLLPCACLLFSLSNNFMRFFCTKNNGKTIFTQTEKCVDHFFYMYVFALLSFRFDIWEHEERTFMCCGIYILGIIKVCHLNNIIISLSLV